jgi:hypothetical protein
MKRSKNCCLQLMSALLVVGMVSCGKAPVNSPPQADTQKQKEQQKEQTEKAKEVAKADDKAAAALKADEQAKKDLAAAELKKKEDQDKLAGAAANAQVKAEETDQAFAERVAADEKKLGEDKKALESINTAEISALPERTKAAEKKKGLEEKVSLTEKTLTEDKKLLETSRTLVTQNETQQKQATEKKTELEKRIAASEKKLADDKKALEARKAAADAKAKQGTDKTKEAIKKSDAAKENREMRLVDITPKGWLPTQIETLESIQVVAQKNTKAPKILLGVSVNGISDILVAEQQYQATENQKPGRMIVSPSLKEDLVYSRKETLLKGAFQHGQLIESNMRSLSDIAEDMPGARITSIALETTEDQAYPAENAVITLKP